MLSEKISEGLRKQAILRGPSKNDLRPKTSTELNSHDRIKKGLEGRQQQEKQQNEQGANDDDALVEKIKQIIAANPGHENMEGLQAHLKQLEQNQ
jgi:hypothetical protein